MRTRFGREIFWLTMPVVMFAGFAWWKMRQSQESAPPEDLEVGPPRVVAGKMQWQEITPFDRYRGITHRLEVTSWIGGNLPPVTTSGRPDVNGTHREVITSFVSRPTNLNLVAGSGRARLPRIYIESGGQSTNLRTPLKTVYLLRTGKAANVRVQGTLSASVLDSESRKAGGSVSRLNFLKEWALKSKTVDIPVPPNQSGTAAVTGTRICPLKLHSLGYSPPDTENDEVYFEVELKSELLPEEWRKQGGWQIPLMQIVDAQGTTLKMDSDFLSDDQPDPQGLWNIAFSLSISRTQWKKLHGSISLQSIISQNGCWPLEVNVLLPQPEVAARQLKPSPFKFPRPDAVFQLTQPISGR